MKFVEIIKSNSWLSVELTFLKMYPDEKSNISEYEQVFKSLQQITPIETDISIIVNFQIDDYDNSQYVDVSGYYNDPKKSENELSSSLALEFTSWDKWLGMDIDKKTLRYFSELEIICHCLHEMTYFSFEQEDIKDEFDRIKGVIEKVKNMSEEDKKKKLIPFDEKKYKKKDKNNDVTE